MKYIDLTHEDRLEILQRVSNDKGYRQIEIVEKDWWVTQVLKALYALPYGKHLSFKGGTSLSKCWGVINRFSEDIDIAIDREFLGFEGELSKTQISDRLRRAACSFVRERMQHDLRQKLIDNGIADNMFEISVNITPITTTDPEIIEVIYQPTANHASYVRPRVIIEVSGRSMSEPVKEVSLCSMIDEIYPTAPFHEDNFTVRAVLPERTFLEKLFLLHEEFAKPKELVRIERMSRHMYDISQILKTAIAENAITDESLYRQVIKHRRRFIGLRGFDYDTLYPATLSLQPPTEVLDGWRNDYENLCKTMVCGDTIPFDDILAELNQLEERIKRLGYKK